MHLELNSSDSEHTDDEDDNVESGRKDFFKSAKEKSVRRRDSTASGEGESPRNWTYLSLRVRYSEIFSRGLEDERGSNQNI
jgi:hypothetical protein